MDQSLKILNTMTTTMMMMSIAAQRYCYRTLNISNALLIVAPPADFPEHASRIK
jgi:hypothetical protein